MNLKAIALLLGLVVMSAGAVAQPVAATPAARECTPPTSSTAADTPMPWWASGFSSQDTLAREMRNRGFIIRGAQSTPAAPPKSLPTTAAEPRPWWASGFASDADLEREMRGRGLMIGRPASAAVLTARAPAAGQDGKCPAPTHTPPSVREPMSGDWGSG